MSTQWFNQSLTQLCHALETSTVNLETVVKAFYQRIADRDPQVQAWQYLVSEQDYLKQYHSHQQFYKNSLLKGLPVAIKDVIDTAGIPTCMGSKIHADRIPAMDAAVVTAIKQAGGIIMGKTVTTEFAFFKAGKTHNPLDPLRTPGGSSSGSAAAVADFMVPFALGTQTAASAIRPASYCGCLAYVASKNEFGLRNIQPLAQSLDSLGLFANHFTDLQLMRNVMQLRPDTALQQVATSQLKFAVYTGQHLGEIEAEMAEAFAGLLQQLKQHAIELVEIPNSIDLKALEESHIQIMAFEVARNLQFEYHTGMLDAYLSALIETGLALPYSEYLHHLQKVALIKQQYQCWLNDQNIQITLAPAASGVAPLGLEKTGLPFMSRPWQVMGLPVTTFPMHYKNKLPLGVQLIGQYQQDDFLLGMSQYIQNLLEND